MRTLLMVLVAAGLVRPLLAEEIHTAAQAGDLQRVQTLIAGNPALVTLATDRSCRPLHYAADAGSVEIIALLLDRGADLTALDADGDTPLHWAAIRGHCDAIELLLDRGADIDARNHHDATPLLYAAMTNQYAAVELLVRRGADLELPNDYGRTPLLYVTREGGDIDMARLLLRWGANVDARDRFADTPLALAAWRGFRALVDLFLDQGAEVETQGQKGEALLAYATERGLERLYQALIDGGVAIPVDQEGMLHAAAQGGSRAIVKDLLARGAAANAQDIYGWTALHYAAVRGRDEVAEELCARGADLAIRTTSGFTALNLAEQERRDRTVSVLRRRGAETTSRNYPVLRGPYLGQPSPGDRPGLFAPDIVASPWGEHGSVSFSPDGCEAFWSGGWVTPDSGYGFSTIRTVRLQNGKWTEPCQAPFAQERGDDVPFFAPTGDRLFFISRRPLSPEQRGGKENIWVIAREGDDWGAPRPLPPCVNSMPHHWQIAVAASGNLYFNSRRGSAETAGLYLSRFRDGEYQAPEFLEIAGSTPYVAPDESYLLFTRFTDAGIHIFVAFAQGDGAWGDAIDVSATVNPELAGMCPIVSPNGQYLFFIRGANNIHWMRADFLEALRAQQGKG